MTKERSYDFMADHAKLTELRNNPPQHEHEPPIFTRVEKISLVAICSGGMFVMSLGFFL